MSHKPPKNDAERLENVLAGLAPIDDDELDSVEEIKTEAEAAGIDFEAWGKRIRKKALDKMALDAAVRIAEERAAHDEEARLIRARPRPTGTREEKVTLLRALTKRAEGKQLSAHFRDLEEMTDDELDHLIVTLEHLLERDGS
jgi:hypothetical protein